MRAVIRTGELQLRPVLMTCVVAGVGLLPAAVSEGIGSQVRSRSPSSSSPACWWRRW